MAYIYYLGRIKRDALDTRRKETTLESMHAEAGVIQAMPHPFLWEEYEDIERHSPETIEDDIKQLQLEYTSKPFFALKEVETFYRTFEFRPVFATKEGMESLIAVFKMQGMDTTDYEHVVEQTNWETHTLILYGF